MRKIALCCGAVVLAIAVSGCAVTHSGAPERVESLPAAGLFDVQKNIVYTPADWPTPLQADIYTPRGQGPFPAVLVVHGGGWVRGSRGQMERIAQRLAEQGFVAVNISYRLAPAFHFPAPLQDLQHALRWMHAHAAEQRIDEKRIAAWGYSAGAQLVSLLGALSSGDPNFVEGTRVRAVVSGGTPTDLRVFGKSPLVLKYIGQTLEEAPELHRQASPIAFVSADDPPMFLYHGSIDWVVGDINAKRMRDEAQRVGVPVELYIVHGVGHIAAFYNDGAIDAGVNFLIRQLQ